MFEDCLDMLGDMDSLSIIFRSVRLASGLMARSRLTAPWGIRFELPEAACQFVPEHVLKSPSGRAPVAVFHAVMEGHCWIRSEGEQKWQEMRPGDMAILPRGGPHFMADQPGTRCVEISSLQPRKDGDGFPLLEYGGGGAQSRNLCGTFRLDQDVADALFSLLPPLIHVPAGEGTLLGPIQSALRLLHEESGRAGTGSEVIITRLTDILFVQVLRWYVETYGSSLKGWLAAVHDEHIGKTLALIHEAPAADWSAGSLAGRVGLSRSRFFERFTELVGEPPARYLARQRTKLALELLRHPGLSTAQIAERVGYSSEDAFVRVFKRYTGASPSQYRRSLRRNGADMLAQQQGPSMEQLTRTAH